MTTYQLINYIVDSHSRAINDALDKGHITQAVYLDKSAINYINSIYYNLGCISEDAYRYFDKRLYLLAGQKLEMALINADMSNLDKELISSTSNRKER